MSILGIGTSGLLAYQRALATTSHNISNASTEGYSRQRLDLATQTPQRLGSSFTGQGVKVSSVERMQDNLVAAQLRTALSSHGDADMRANHAEEIDALVAGDTTGLAPVLESFFSAIQEVATDPTSMSARTVMVNEADTLVERLGQLNGLFESERELVNGQIETTVDEINQYSRSLAGLNTEIVAGYATGGTPNDLLDQRDQILNQLSEKIDVGVTTQDDGSISVFVGHGQSLVSASVSNELVADHLSADRENVRIGIKAKSGNAPVDVTTLMSGGELGGLLETRKEMLDGPQNQIGLIALNMAARFNEQNRAGFDINGAAGGDIFKLPSVAVSGNSTNVASELPAVSFADVSQVTASDYRLIYDGSSYHLKQIPENASIALTEVPVGSGVYEADGLAIDTSAMGAPPALAPEKGDDWLIQPTRFAASELGLAITDPERIAAAAETGHVGDNRNMLAMAGIQSEPIVKGSMTLQEGYTSVVAEVGTQTRQAQIARDATATTLESVRGRRESLSGVNLDEEAANLMRFQQAYEASAKVIATAGAMFDALMGMMR